MTDRGPRTCVLANGRSKSVFASKAHAKRYIRKGGLTTNFGPRSSAAIYRCASCAGWHIGHKLGKENPA